MAMLLLTGLSSHRRWVLGRPHQEVRLRWQGGGAPHRCLGRRRAGGTPRPARLRLAGCVGGGGGQASSWRRTTGRVVAVRFMAPVSFEGHRWWQRKRLLCCASGDSGGWSRLVAGAVRLRLSSVSSGPRPARSWRYLLFLQSSAKRALAIGSTCGAEPRIARVPGIAPGSARVGSVSAEALHSGGRLECAWQPSSAVLQRRRRLFWPCLLHGLESCRRSQRAHQGGSNMYCPYLGPCDQAALPDDTRAVIAIVADADHARLRVPTREWRAQATHLVDRSREGPDPVGV